MITEQVGMRIRELRTRKGFSQEKLALEAEIDRTYLAGIENGRRNPTLKSLEKILRTLEISFEDFFKGIQ
ncbi:MAG: helix-turn-helix transcriptional regulator [Faecalibacterium prausnitzii]|nr:helix-turn-helix transcriptional regulator [Faecalibacterium prausnitzii]